MEAYYNENDPYPAQWLRNLMAAGQITQGRVDESDIQNVGADGLAGVGRAHFFAGIGGWDYALQLAGWPAERPVWTGSCPCQPFSSAGRRRGVEDERHLWPFWRSIIAECRPATIFGEQVASADGRAWLNGVRVDLEALGYAVGAADLCAAGAGSPQIRQRLWWVADADRSRHIPKDYTIRAGGLSVDFDSGAGGLGNAPSVRQAQGKDPEAGGGNEGAGIRSGKSERAGADGRLGNGDSNGRKQGQEILWEGGFGTSWSGSEIVWCDEREFGKGWVARRVEPGTFPLAHRVSQRVGRLRAYGNAIVPQVAAEFIKAFICG